MPKVALAGFLQTSAVSLRTAFGDINIRTRHNFPETVSLTLFTEIISLQRSHFILSSSAAQPRITPDLLAEPLLGVHT